MTAPMRTYFVRHIMDIDEATLRALWSARRVAIHYPDTHPEDGDKLLLVRDNESLDPEAGVKLGLEMPCERAATLLGELTDTSMSDCAIHEVLHELGEGLDVLQVAPSAETIQARVAQAAEGRKWKPILVLAADAADVPSRPEDAKGTRPGRKKRRARRRRWKGQYYEAKGFRFG